MFPDGAFSSRIQYYHLIMIPLSFILFFFSFFLYLLYYYLGKEMSVRRSLSKTLDGTFKLHYFCVFVISSGFQSHCVSFKLDLGENLPTFCMFIHHKWRGSFWKVTAQVITAGPKHLWKSWLDLQIMFVTDSQFSQTKMLKRICRRTLISVFHNLRMPDMFWANQNYIYI